MPKVSGKRGGIGLTVVDTNGFVFLTLAILTTKVHIIQESHRFGLLLLSC
jgi:hypothetical protein